MTDRHVWVPPPTALSLGPHEVHVWRAGLELPAEYLRRLRDTLSEEERAQAGRFHFIVHRDRFVASRGIQRAILARYVGIAPAELLFRYSVYGKPELNGGAETIRIR